MKISIVLIALTLHLTQSAALYAATFTVSNLNDSGQGSLREAIQSANASNGNGINFSVNGTITLLSPLPEIGKTMRIDGTSAPGYAGVPQVAVDFNGREGMVFALGADKSILQGLSLIGSSGQALTLRASQIIVQGNYIGLRPNGSVRANFGDGIQVVAPSKDNVIGNLDPIDGIAYSDSAAFPNPPVTRWLGIRNNAAVAGEFLISGNTGNDGLLYVGPSDGTGTSHAIRYPGVNTISTTAVGPDNAGNGVIRVAGSYRTSDSAPVDSFGFIWEGTTAQLPSGGTFRQVAYPNATHQRTQSSMGDIAVGNANVLGGGTAPLGTGIAYIYNLQSNTFATTVVYPGSKSNVVYGVWQNSATSYTICGGYSLTATNNLADPSTPLAQGKAFLVDYNPATNTLSNWTSFDYRNGLVGPNFATQFQGISSAEPGVYTLSANTAPAAAPDTILGSWVEIRRAGNGSFTSAAWVDLNYTGADAGVTTSNSVYGNTVVGTVNDASPFAYQAVISTSFQLSNVISGNGGNGITLSGTSGNKVAMNFIGTDTTGSATLGFGNAGQGIWITQRSSANLIGGTAFGINNPTGSKDPANAVFQRPAQGNLISGNLGNGVLIDAASFDNTLSGNFIGTDASGLIALGNGMDGVSIRNAPRNSLIGCTFYENPFVYYNVVSGNRGHGVRVENSNDVYVQANFLGMGADNATSVPNGGNGLLVSGSSRATQVGGVIPLGNVISGNTLNGIEVRDTASQFISFNTFGGIAAFQTFASPNGRNGILITSTGANNVVRTCIISGNNGNGIEIGGNASGVEITDTSVGTTTTITGGIPNLGSGIVISGTAHNNAIGGFQPSVEPTVFVCGNKGYGIAIVDQASNNIIYGSNIGVLAAQAGALPNEFGGILLDVGTSGTTVGGTSAGYPNIIQSNDGAGLTINSSTNNTIVMNSITENTVVGLYASGACNGTYVTSNTIENNGPGGTNNIDISNASGITLGPRPAPVPPPAAAPTPTPDPAEVQIEYLQNRIYDISRNVKNPIARSRQINRAMAQIRRIQERSAIEAAAAPSSN